MNLNQINETQMHTNISMYEFSHYIISKQFL